MGRYKIEVTAKVVYSVMVDADTAMEALDAARRQEGEAEQVSAPEWLFGEPMQVEGD